MDKEILEYVNNRCAYNKYNGIEVTYLDSEKCIVEGELRTEAMNPWGMAHGGFVYSLCDVAAGVVAGQGVRISVTMGSSINFLSPSVGKRLTVEGKILKNGHTVVFVETNVYNEEGLHTATGQFQIFLKDEV